MNQLDYCNFGDYASIKTILEKAFTITDFSEIEKAYQTFKGDFLGTPLSEPHTTIERSKFLPKTSDGEFLEKYNDINYTIGFDLPVLISKKDAVRGKRIFIIGEDALREGKINENIILSTPFGTHDKAFREGHGKTYWEYSLWLLEQGYQIYYTDIKKMWIKKSNASKKLTLPNDLLESFEKCLAEEIKTFHPEIIIAFGKDAKVSISRLKVDAQSIDFIHPTFAASIHWIRQYGLNHASNENKLNYMKNKFEEMIKSNVTVV